MGFFKVIIIEGSFGDCSDLIILKLQIAERLVWNIIYKPVLVEACTTWGSVSKVFKFLTRTPSPVNSSKLSHICNFISIMSKED